jgi:hypothetical protein
MTNASHFVAFEVSINENIQKKPLTFHRSCAGAFAGLLWQQHVAIL